MLLQDELLISSNELISLSGEDEHVHEELNDELVALDQGESNDSPDSDESSDDEVVECMVSPQGAPLHAMKLESYVASHPEHLSAESIDALVQVRRKMEMLRMQYTVQTRMTQSLMR